MNDMLNQIYDEELRSRISQLRLALALCGASEVKARKQALYDAHLQAHTIKGSSEQLGFKEAARLAGAMSGALEDARSQDILGQVVRERIERGCNAFLTWVDNGRTAARPLTFAAVAFTLEESKS